MPLTIGCTTCNKQLRLPESLLGQLVRCPSCHNDFVVTENSGRVAVQPMLPDGRPAALPAVNPAARRGAETPPPMVLPVTKPRPGESRPFVFRVVVLADPERRLAGELQARAHAGGLELRDRQGRMFHVAVGSPARHLGGNRFSVNLGTRDLTLRIDQRKCQQTKLAIDLVAFLLQQRGELRIADYRPRVGPRLLALLPLLLPCVFIPLQIGSTLGVVLWIAIGLLATLVSWLVLRAESMTQKKRLKIAAIFWGVGMAAILALAPAIHHAGNTLNPPRLTWVSYTSSDLKWTVQMPGQVEHEVQILAVPKVGAGRLRPRLFDIAKVDLPFDRGTFAVWSTDFKVDEFDALAPEQIFQEIRDAYQDANRYLRPSSEAHATLQQLYPGREWFFQGSNGSRTRVRIYLVRPCVYVQIATWKGKVSNYEVDRFFQTFQLTPAGQATPPDFNDKDLPQPVPPDKRGAAPWSPERPPRRLAIQPASAMPGCLLHWKFDEGQGNHLQDSSGHEQHGTIHGGWWVDGINGKALLLDGKGDYIDYGASPDLNLPHASGWTFSLWVATKEANGVLLSQRSKISTAPLFDVLVEQGTLKVLARQNGLFKDDLVLLGAKIDDGHWHHIAVARQDGGGLQMFVDGHLLEVQQFGPINNATGAITTDWRTMGCERSWVLREKRRDPGSYFHGCVAEFAIFNRELTAPEVQKLAGW